MTRDIKKEIYDYIPRYYSDSRVVKNVLDPESVEFTVFNEKIVDVLNQFSVETATWALSRWEKNCNIATDETKSYEARRSVIKAKLRGMGIVTKTTIQSVVDSYNIGKIEVMEEPANYRITLTIVGTRGVPINLSLLEKSLRELLPAHLGIDFVFTYLVFDELDNNGVTWEDFETYDLSWDELQSWDPNGKVFIRASLGLTQSEQ